MFLGIFFWLCSKKCSVEFFVVLSCVISYVFISIIKTFDAIIWHCEFIDNPLIMSGIAVMCAIILSIVISMLCRNELFKKITIRLFNTTPNASIWDDVFDLKQGSNLKVYLKDKDYYIIGHHRNHEEKGADLWLALSAFGKFDKITNENYKNEPNYFEYDNVVIAIRFNDIEHIEIF